MHKHVQLLILIGKPCFFVFLMTAMDTETQLILLWFLNNQM